VVLPQDLAIRLPANISYEAGACLGIPAMTAWHALALAGAREGTTLLIAGGAGAVAHYAIQFAKARKATVLTTVSSAAKAKLAREAGADHAIDYKSENVGERVMEITRKAGVDAVLELDLAANATLLPGVMRQKGTVVVYGTGRPEAQIPSQFCLTNGIRLQFMLIYEITPEERRHAINDITRMLEANRLIHNVALTPALGDVVAAHQAVESGKTSGNVVMRVG